MTEPTRDAVLGWLADRNWGRWGEDDQRGAVNLITPAKRAAAAALVRSGRSLSLARPFPTVPHPGNPHPAQRFLSVKRGEDGSGSWVDHLAISYHGYAATHLDALCHVYVDGRMWGGRDPFVEVDTDGARFGDVDQWRDGIVTRGVLLDVVAHRGGAHVDVDTPVHGDELEAIAAGLDLTLEPGDAVVVHSGRDAWEERHGPLHRGLPARPGLHASCLPFLRRHDVAVLAWDMMDAAPNPYGLRWSVHHVLQAYGIALVDNCALAELAIACAEEGRWAFLLTVAPLRVAGGTGSPVNPLALF